MGAIIRTCSHLESWRPPASQLSIAVSAPNSFDERIIREIIEFKKVAIARPARIKEIFELLEANFDKEFKLNELETRIAHQDHSIEKMSDEIYRQQKQIVQLEEKVRRLVDRLELIASPQSSNNEPDEAPPHY